MVVSLALQGGVRGLWRSNDNAVFVPSVLPAMRAMLTFTSLLIVLAVVAVAVRNQLHASQRFLPATAASGAAPIVVDPANPQQAVSQYQRDLDKAMKADAQHTADLAASAADEGTR